MNFLNFRAKEMKISKMTHVEMKDFSGKTNEPKTESLVKYLQSRISDGSSLEDIVNAFEDMCNIPIKEDMILFETGTYSFTGEPMFEFSLVRQFPNDEDEYYQLHINVLYIPTKENMIFEQTTWNEDIEENIFDYIRKTPVFAYCKENVFSGVEIYLDET